MRLPFFQRKATARPALARYPMASLGYAGGVSQVRGYEGLVRDGFARNPIGQRAVRTVSEAVAAVPLAVSPEGHLLAALLATPSNSQSATEFFEAVASYLLLHGNAYIETVDGADGLPVAMYALRPERVTIEADARGWPSSYVYRTGGVTTRYAAVDAEGRPGLLHIRTFNPLDDHYGLGCLGAAAAAIDTHNAAGVWNAALLQNAARPSGALMYEPADGSVLSAEQYERLKAEMEAGFAGAANGGRPMLLEGGLRWQPMSMTPAELDFAASKAGAAREIALAFGVPPMLLGLPGDNTYANYAEANRALFRLTVMPLAEKLADAMTQFFQGWWPEASVRVDRNQIPALADDRATLWSTVGAATFLSDAEKRAMVGLDAMPAVAS